VGERVIMLHGMGAVHHAADSSHVTTAVGINLVAPVVRVDGRRLWVVATSGDDSGWVDSAGVLRLAAAIPYFSALIAPDSSAWDAYLRRAEAAHALNQRAAATRDNTAAIRLHPREAFLYLRRGRHSGCVYFRRRDPGRALAAIRHAIALDSTRAIFFVQLAAASAKAGDLRAAVSAQRRALASHGAAPSYRDEWRRQLETYERALARRQAP
jgi:tetratricopeptide (TPR) repeat protein